MVRRTSLAVAVVVMLTAVATFLLRSSSELLRGLRTSAVLDKLGPADGAEVP